MEYIIRNGLDISSLLECKTKYYCLITPGTKQGDRITNEELLEVDCDILVPSAMENQITQRMPAK